MLSSIRQRVKAWRTGGRHRVAVRIAGAIYRQVTEFRTLVALAFVRVQIRRTRPVRDPDALLTLAYEGFARTITPLQVRREITGFTRAVSTQKPKRLLEIGTARGGNAVPSDPLGRRRRARAQRRPPGGWFGGGYPWWKRVLYRAFARPGQKLELIRAYSHSQDAVERVKMMLGGEPLDFLMIDGDHTCRSVLRDESTEGEDTMAMLVGSQFVTVDGVMEDPEGSEGTPGGARAFKFNRGHDGDKFKLDELMASDCLLLGRVTYQGFAQAWPGRTDEQGFADKSNSMPKYVVSTTLKDPAWNNSTVIEGNVAEEVSKLKQQPRGDILVNGSRTLVPTLMEHDLVDEYRLMVFPIVLGGGKRLFDEGSAASDLKLVDAKPVGDEGVLVLSYRPARKE